MPCCGVPDFVEPCLPSPVERPPAGPDWIHEIKHDGFRLIARRGAERVRLFTRNFPARSRIDPDRAYWGAPNPSPVEDLLRPGGPHDRSTETGLGAKAAGKRILEEAGYLHFNARPADIVRPT
jgi:hypothetical protein